MCRIPGFLGPIGRNFLRIITIDEASTTIDRMAPYKIRNL